MKSRWDLIQSGTNREDIRIRGNSIYVNDLRKGSIVNGVLIDNSTSTQPDEGNKSQPESDGRRSTTEDLMDPIQSV